MLQGVLPLVPAQQQFGFTDLFDQLGPVFLALGWLLLVFLLMWVVWNTYIMLKRIDYFSAIEWVFLEVKVPPTSEETPKSMEIFYEVLGGMHKSPDLVELYFDGYMEAWISCEIVCTPGRVRYMIVVPAAHRQFVEGIIYSQYPQAEITEAEDYTQKYSWKDIREKFDLFGTEIVLVEDDIYPIKTYLDFETVLAEEDKFVDPHQAIVEIFTHINPGEEFWMQVCVKPIDAGSINKWAQKGGETIAEISGEAKEPPPGILGQVKDWFVALPGDLLSAFFNGPTEPDSQKDEQQFRFFNPVDEAKMKGILQKTSRTGFATKIRILYIAPSGQLQKPNIGRAIGAFKQFNTFHLNSVKPDPATKSNGPDFVAREVRRKLRERKIFLQYQWRELWYGDGYMMNAEELATLYHFPSKYVRTPGVARARAGLQSPPDNLPYAG